MAYINRQLYTTAQIRELEQIAIQQHTIAEYTLMQRAGQAAYQVLKQHWPNATKICVMAGRGNNGGDGYEVARLCRAAGLTVKVYVVGGKNQLKNAASQAYEACVKANVNITPYQQAQDFNDAEVIIDALLGTGLTDETVRDPYAKAITAINASQKEVLALDVPSGIHADTGETLGVAIKAKYTLTFIGLKRGLFTGEAPDYCGKILLDDLSLPKELFGNDKTTSQLLELSQYSTILKPRVRTANKGKFGHALIIGGDIGMAGAVILAATACLRVGAGLCSVVTHKSHVAIVTTHTPEVMCHGIDEVNELEPLIAKASVIAIGPGLGQSAWSKRIFTYILTCQLPLVIDADALNLLAKSPSKRQNWILTPHPGEAARLLDMETVAIQKDRFAAAAALQRCYGGVNILKGAGTLIQSEQAINVCPYGNPGMATGGMGDVLTGVVVGLVAQRLDLVTAANLGVALHGKAGDKAALGGERGLLASDLLPYLQQLSNFV